MSRIYEGLPAQIKKMSPLAEYISCGTHSLNLVGESVAESCDEASAFLTFLKNLATSSRYLQSAGIFFKLSIIQRMYPRTKLAH